MWVLTDIAAWWDNRKGRSEQQLQQFVENHPNKFGVIVATAIHSSMVIGAGLVDLLRIGDGVKEGGLTGFGKDGLRLIGIVGPVGKGVQVIKSASRTEIASLIVDVGGPRCSWVASTKALAQTGNRSNGKLFSSVDDLFHAVGIPMKNAAGIPLHTMVANLKRIGALVGPVKDISTMSKAVQMLPRNGSVVMLSLKGLKEGIPVAGHAVYIFYDKLGRLKIMDRSGVYQSLEELSKRYRQVDEFIPRSASKIDNVRAKFVGPKGAAILAMEVLGVVADQQ